MLEREQIVEEIRACRDAYLESPDLDEAWIAGWRAAIAHAAYVVWKNDDRRVDNHPDEVTRDAEVAARAILDCAAAMPVYGRKGEPAQFDGDDVREYLKDYAHSLVTVTKPRTRSGLEKVRDAVELDRGMSRAPSKPILFSLNDEYDD